MKAVKLKHLFLLHIFLLFALIFMVSYCDDLDGSGLKVGDFVTLGHYDNEPIIWQVVSFDKDGNPLLLSRRILTVKAFDASGNQYDEDGYYSYERYYGSNRWETSTLRAWLNSDDQRVNWTYNAPNASNLFRGEKPYDMEVGFLHRNNFSVNEKSIIKETSYTSDVGEPLNDKIFLLSMEEAMAFSGCYPMQQLKHQAISKPYDIWTRDGVKDAPHAVYTLKWDGSQSKSVASVSRSGVAPALQLDLEKIEALEMSGNGLSYKPYYFDLKTDSYGLIIFCFTTACGLLVWIVIKLWRNARKQVVYALISLVCIALFLTVLHDLGLRSNAENKVAIEDETEKYLIILPYALNIDMIEKRTDELFEGEAVLVIAQDGSDKTQKVLSEYSAPKTHIERETFIKAIHENNWRIVRRGDYRVTTLKKEIDDVFADKSMVVPISTSGSSEVTDQRELFKKAVGALYAKQNFDAIADYLRSNNLEIVHPLDLGGVGIGPLYVFYE